MTVPIQAADWRKSGRSSGNDTCVEVHRDLHGLRDSKHITGPTLTVDAAGLVTAIQAGRITR